MIAAAQVRANRTRQAVDRARARGHVPRPMSPQAPPAAAERAYTARLRMIVGGALTRAYAPLLRALPDLVAQARQERGDAADWRSDATNSGRSASAAVKEAAREAQASLGGSVVRAAAQEAAGDASAHVQAQLGKQVREVLGIDLAADARAKARAAAFVHENVKLISGIGPTLAAEVERLVLAGLTGGHLHEMLAQAIRRKLQVATDRAELIAIDQVGKIVGQINAARQQDLGVTHFYWRTSKDERVRGNPAGKYPNAVPSHYDREGKRYAYADPPKGKNGEPELPGTAIRCRCGAEADLSTVLGEEPAAPAPRDPAVPDAPNRAPSVEEAEAEAERLRREVEAMLAGQGLPGTPTASEFARQLAVARAAPPASTPDPSPPAPATPSTSAKARGQVPLREIVAASVTGHPQVPEAREAAAMASGTVVAYALNGKQGASESYRALYESGGERMRAIVKPLSGMRRSQRHPNQLVREVGAAAVAGHLGVGDMMQTTVARDVPGLGPSSSQAFAEGALHSSQLTAEQVARFDRDGVVRMRVFDFVIGNTDRHDENVMWRDDGQRVTPVLIDHGYTIPTKPPTGLWQPEIRGIHLDDTPLSDRARAAIRDANREDIATVLAESGLEMSAIQGTLYRIAMAQLDPDLLDVAPGEGIDAARSRWEAAASDPSARLDRALRVELDGIAYQAVKAARRGRP